MSAVRKIAEGDYSSDRYRGSVLSRRFMLRYVVQMIDRETNQVRYSTFEDERSAVAAASRYAESGEAPADHSVKVGWR